MRTLVVQTLTGVELTVELTEGATGRDVKQALRDGHGIPVYQQRLLVRVVEHGAVRRLADSELVPADVSRLHLVLILALTRFLPLPPPALDLAGVRYRPNTGPWAKHTAATLAECTRAEALRKLRLLEHAWALGEGYHLTRTPPRVLDLAMPRGNLQLPRRKRNAWLDGTERRYPLLLPLRRRRRRQPTSAGHVMS